MSEQEQTAGDFSRDAHNVSVQTPPGNTSQVLERITGAYFALDRDWHFTYLNTQAEHLLQRSRSALLGREIWQEFPAAIGAAFDHEYRRAMREQIPVSFEAYYPPPLDTWFEVRAYPSPKELSVYFHDINAQKSAEAERRRAEEALQQSEERYRLLVEGARDYAMILMDGEGRVTNWNTGAERIMGWSEDEVLGQPADLIFLAEDCERGIPEREMQKAAREGRALDIRWHRKKDGSQFFADGVLEILRDEVGQMRGFAKILRDATERKRAEEQMRERARLVALTADVSHALASNTPLEDMLHGCAEALVTHLEAAFARIWTLNAAGTVLELQASAGLYTHLNGPHSRVPVGQFKIGLIAQERRPHLTNSVLSDVRVGDQAWAKQEGMVAFAGYPLIVDDRLVGVVAMFARQPLSEVVLQAVGSAADEIAVGIERKHAEHALRQAHETLEAVIGASPLAVVHLDMDGKVLLWSRAAEELFGWSAEEVLGNPVPINLPERWTELPSTMEATGMDGTALETETFQRRKDGALIEVALWTAPVRTDASRASGMVVTVADIGERRALEREQERLAAREHAIATQFQEALQPPLPDAVPGLRLKKYYEAALEEAGVGGDFYDVFPLDEGCAVLVVGDLSGKGLAAAAQVSIVRNMLRAFLYSKSTLAEAVTDLNHVMATHRLLPGFATLWVGCYDSVSHQLVYVNLGQEPALVRRANTGQVEHLLPTGPVLGVFENAVFEEKKVTLAPGDAFAVFSDGLTEVGFSRREMLGVEGVAALLQQPIPPEEAENAEEIAETIALHLIAGVDAAARGGVARDDVCLLVGVVE